jgi:hypothetical protein
MPYKSDAQRAYFNANRAKLEQQGVDVDEWNSASKGMKLPKRAKGKDKKSGWTSLAELGRG